jgi:hypothetical protein
MNIPVRAIYTDDLPAWMNFTVYFPPLNRVALAKLRVSPGDFVL